MSNDPLATIDAQERFGLHVDQEVTIINAGPFSGQVRRIVEFTSEFVVVPVSGPPGEPMTDWWFKL